MIHDIVWIQSRFKFIEKKYPRLSFYEFNINIFRYQTRVTTPEVSL